jgi:histidinol-phosphate aminotransferase
MDPETLIRPQIVTMEPYTPVFPFEVLAAHLGRKPDEIIKLNANENPYGPPPCVQDALARVPYVHIYPDPESRALREALAAFTGVPITSLMAGLGADELIDLTMRLFVQPGDAIINCPPTFGMYPFDADINGAQCLSIERGDDFSLDIDEIEAVVAQHRPKLMFIASPNNPDGSWLSSADLERLLALPLVVVLDEAYVEFASTENSRITMVSQCENLIVLRTFSKWAGLAGMRVGYGAFPVNLMPHLWKIKQPYNVPVASAAAAIAILNDPDYLTMHITRMVAERERLSNLLAEIPYLRPYPSQSTYVLCQVLERDAHGLKQALENAGILIRYYKTPRLRDHIRISVGRPDQTDTLIKVLRSL